VIPGALNKTMALLTNVVPTRVAAKIVRKLNGK
jgi:hypothetical protein